MTIKEFINLLTPKWWADRKIYRMLNKIEKKKNNP